MGGQGQGGLTAGRLPCAGCRGCPGCGGCTGGRGRGAGGPPMACAPCRCRGSQERCQADGSAETGQNRCLTRGAGDGPGVRSLSFCLDRGQEVVPGRDILMGKPEPFCRE